MGLYRIDKDIPVSVFRPRPLYFHFLVPAVLAADEIRLNWKGEVLVYSPVLPPYSLGVRVLAFKRPHAVDLAHLPFSRLDLLQVNQGCGPMCSARLFLQSPATEVMRAGDNAGSDSFGDPDLVHKVTDLRADFEKVSGRNLQPLCILRMNP